MSQIEVPSEELRNLTVQIKIDTNEQTSFKDFSLAGYEEDDPDQIVLDVADAMREALGISEDIPSKPVDDVTPDDVVQLVVHGALFPALAEWLTGRGLTVSPFPRPVTEVDTYMVGVGRELWESST